MAAALGVGPRRLFQAYVRAGAHGGCSGCAARHVAPPLRGAQSPRRGFSSGSSGQRRRFSQRLGEALRNSRIQWYQIPVGLGIGFLGLVHFYKVSAREQDKRAAHDDEQFAGGQAQPKPRPRIRPEGPWQVQVMSTLPLKAMSRLWGRFNELTIPYYLRVPGFRLYSLIFGVK